MIVLGIVLLLLGFLFGIPLILYLGIIAVVIGACLLALGSAGRQVGGRRHYY